MMHRLYMCLCIANCTCEDIGPTPKWMQSWWLVVVVTSASVVVVQVKAMSRRRRAQSMHVGHEGPLLRSTGSTGITRSVHVPSIFTATRTGSTGITRSVCSRLSLSAGSVLAIMLWAGLRLLLQINSKSYNSFVLRHRVPWTKTRL